MSTSSANLNDLPQLTRLLAVLFAQESEFAPNSRRQETGLRLILESTNAGVILIYRDAGEINGMVSLLFTFSTFLGVKVALLEDMVVHPGHRGRGIGSELLRAAIERAKAEGCGRITLLTDADNERAKEFYAHAGFVESTMTPMRLMLPLGD